MLPRIDDLKTWFPAHVSARQLAEYWQVERATVYHWIASGKLKATMVVGCWRIRTDEARLFAMRLARARSTYGTRSGSNRADAAASRGGVD